jgi:ABC-type branched-subunit amino acid transport system substrate-binding protein
MRRLVLIVVVAIILAAMCYVCFVKKDVAIKNKPVIKIGLVAPLSGANAEIANNVKNVIELYIKETAAKNNVRYELIVEDDLFRAKNVKSRVSQLINAEMIDGLITTLAYEGMEIRSIVKKMRIPHINLGSNPAIADGEYSFVNVTPPKLLVEMTLEQFKKDGIEEFAIVYMKDIGPATYVNEIKKQAEGNFKFEEYSFSPTEEDFRILLSKVKKSNAQIIVILALPPSLDILGRQILDRNIDIPLTGFGFFNMSSHKYLFEGQMFADTPVGSKAFIRKMTKALDSENMFILAFAQDTIKIYIDIVEAFYKENRRTPTREEIAERIRNLKDFKGEIGVYGMGEDGMTTSKGVFKEIVNGKVEVIGKYPRRKN